MFRKGFKTTLAVFALAVLATGVALAFQRGGAEPKVSADRFEFMVLESFDAKYLGDTPGHRGKSGGLPENARPHLALGDPVYREQERVGIVTEIVFERLKGSIAVEFDPAPLARISVGDVVWVSIGEKPATPRP